MRGVVQKHLEDHVVAVHNLMSVLLKARYIEVVGEADIESDEVDSCQLIHRLFGLCLSEFFNDCRT